MEQPPRKPAPQIRSDRRVSVSDYGPDEPNKKIPLVSIILPAYNAHNTIKRTLSSIAMQENSNDIEVVIADDCSKYPYDKIAKQFSHMLQIRIVKMLKNGGPGAARQVGFDHCRGQYIMWMDADDTLVSADTVNTLCTVMHSENMDCVYGRFLEENEDGSLFPHEVHMVWMFGKMYRRSFLERYNIRFNTSLSNEDTGFNRVVAGCTEKVLFIPKDVYIWHFKANSITRIKQGMYGQDSGFKGWSDNMAWQILELQKRFVNRNYIVNEIIANMVTHYCFYEENLKHYPMNAEICINWCRGFYHNIYEPNAKYISEELFNNIASKVLSDHNVPEKGIVPSTSLGEFMEMMKAPVEHLPNEETCGATPSGYIPPVTSPDWPVEVTDYFDDVEPPIDVDSDTNHSRYGGMKKAIGVALDDDDYDMEYSGSIEDTERLGILNKKNGSDTVGFDAKPLKPLDEKKAEEEKKDVDYSCIKAVNIDELQKFVASIEVPSLTDTSILESKSIIYKEDENHPEYWWVYQKDPENLAYLVLYLNDFKEGKQNIPVKVYDITNDTIRIYKEHIIDTENKGLIITTMEGLKFFDPENPYDPIKFNGFDYKVVKESMDKEEETSKEEVEDTSKKSSKNIAPDKSKIIPFGKKEEITEKKEESEVIDVRDIKKTPKPFTNSFVDKDVVDDIKESVKDYKDDDQFEDITDKVVSVSKDQTCKSDSSDVDMSKYTIINATEEDDKTEELPKTKELSYGEIKTIIQEADGPYTTDPINDPRWNWDTEGEFRVLYLRDLYENNTYVPVRFVNLKMMIDDVYKYHSIVMGGILVICESGHRYFKSYDPNESIKLEVLDTNGNAVMPKNYGEVSTPPATAIDSTKDSTSPDTANKISDIIPSTEGEINSNTYYGESVSYFGTSYSSDGNAPKAHFDETSADAAPTTPTEAATKYTNGNTTSLDVDKPIISTPTTKEEAEGKTITVNPTPISVVKDKKEEAVRSDVVVPISKAKAKSTATKKKTSTSNKSNTSKNTTAKADKKETTKKNLPKFGAKFEP